MLKIADTNELRTRFYSKVRVGWADECWNWIASTYANGYGQFSIKTKQMNAHRVAWLLEMGGIPDGLHVLHKCDNKLCVKIEHLFLGTHTDNMQDMIAKGRNCWCHLGGWGENNPTAKLNSEEVEEIRRLWWVEGHTCKEIAKLFSSVVVRSAIQKIVAFQSWPLEEGEERIYTPTPKHPKKAVVWVGGRFTTG